MSDSDWASLSEIQIEDYVDGRGEDARSVKKIRVKTHSKIAALGKLCQHLGITKQTSTTVNLQANEGAKVRITLPHNGRDPIRNEGDTHDDN